MRTILAHVALVALLAPDVPARSQSAPEPGTIAGRVVAWETGRPLRRAAVQLTGGLRPQTIATNDEGYFIFGRVLPGRYTVTASKVGYLIGQYGQRHANDRGRPFSVAAGQKIQGIDFRLLRTSAITGRVLDELGDPLPGAVVQALKTRYAHGRRRLVSVASGRTNDIGEFRLAGLAPGAYLVRTVAITGGQDFDGASYAPTFYPGTLDVEDAQAVRVAPLQDASGIELTLTPARSARLSGVVTNLLGRGIVGALVRLVPIFDDPTWSELVDVGFVTTGAQGAFGIGRVQPGEYRLEVQADARPDEPALFATRRMVVTGDDIPDITVMAGPGSTAFGQVVVAGGGPPPPWLNRLAVHTTPGAHGESARGGGSRASVRGRAFTITGLFGARLFRVANLPEGWGIKRVLYRDRDITDTPMEFTGAESLNGLRVELTDRGSELSGTVTDEAGRPVVDGTVLLFSQDRSRWGFESRYVKLARVDALGRYSVSGLPADDYFAVAVADFGTRDWEDPDVLDGLRPLAAPFTLDDAEQRLLDLRISLTASP